MRSVAYRRDMQFILRLVITALALAVAVWVTPGAGITANSPEVESALGPQGATIAAYVVIALIVGIVNALIRPVLSFIAFPITCLTLGLFSLVINALMLMLTAWVSEFTPFQLSLDGFWSALLAALLVAVVSGILGLFVPSEEGAARDRR